MLIWHPGHWYMELLPKVTEVGHVRRLDMGGRVGCEIFEV